MTFPTAGKPELKAKEFLSEEKEVLTVEDALAGAKEIIAEWVSDDADSRKWIRQETFKTGMVEVHRLRIKKRTKKGSMKCIINMLSQLIKLFRIVCLH